MLMVWYFGLWSLYSSDIDYVTRVLPRPHAYRTFMVRAGAHVPTMARGRAARHHPVVKGASGNYLITDVINDSGSEVHLTNDPALFRDGVNTQSGRPVLIAFDNSRVVSDGRGTALGVGDAVLHKGAPMTLLSNAKLHLTCRLRASEGDIYVFADKVTNKIRWTFECYNNLYLLSPRHSPAWLEYQATHDSMVFAAGTDGVCSGDCDNEAPHVHRLPLNRRDDLMLMLHWKLGHATEKTIRRLVKRNLLRGLDVRLSDLGHLRDPCTACLCGRAKRSPNLGVIQRSEVIGHTFSVDERGPFKDEDADGNTHVRTFVCDASGFMVRFLVKTMSSAVAIEQLEEVRTACTLRGHTLTRLRLDRGSHFTSHDMRDFCRRNSITLDLVAPRNKDANGIAEAHNLHLMNRLRTYMIGLPTSFWGYAAMYETLAYNAMTSSRSKTPFELFHGQAPSFRLFELFGCSGVYHVPEENKAKPRGRTGYYVGATDRGWLVVDKLQPGKPILTNDFVPEQRSSIRRVLDTLGVDYAHQLYETFPIPVVGESSSTTLPPKVVVPLTATSAVAGEPPPKRARPAVGESPCEPIPAAGEWPLKPLRKPQRQHGTPPRDSIPEAERRAAYENYVPSAADVRATQDYQSEVIDEVDRQTTLRRSRRQRTETRRMREHREAMTNPQVAMTVAEYVLQLHLQQSSGLSFFEVKVPKHFGEAMTSAQKPSWLEAITSEHDGLLSRDVYEWVRRADLPQGARVLGSRWVFDIKRMSDGVIARFKARLVVRGDQQKQGVDFGETYSAVVGSTTLRVLLSIANTNNLLLHHVDVVQAFLCASLEEEVYVTPPQGIDAPPGYVWKLKKSLYGLRQAPRAFNHFLTAIMVDDLRFDQCNMDECVFIRRTGGEVLYVAVFVDDLVIAGSTPELIEAFKQEIRGFVEIKDLGELTWCLGMKIDYDRDAGRLAISQTLFVDDLLTRANMVEARSSYVPASPDVILSRADCPTTEAELAGMIEPPYSEYRSLIGSVMYLSVCTRPDISFAVSQLATRPPGTKILFQSQRLVNALDWSIPCMRRSKNACGQFISLTTNFV